MDREQLKVKINNLIPFIFGKFKSSGYTPLKEDNRDFKIGSLFSRFLGEAYSPLYDSVDIETISIKDQKRFNTCVFNSATVGKEVDENVVLSVRSLTADAYRNGMISGNGFSDLRSAQKRLSAWGIEEEADCRDGRYSESNNFSDYVNVSLDQTKAEVHKTKTFWSVSTKEEILKLLDLKRPIHCAIPWYSGYNQGGGFSSPWLITKTLGYFIGGHAVLCRGYIKNYQGKFVVKIQNSYSELWGDKGCFYMDIDFFVNQINKMGYGAYTNLDLDSDIGSFLSKFDGKNVKELGSPAIYHIQNGVKKLYPDWPTFLAWDGNLRGFSNLTEAESTILRKVQNGDNMDISKSVYWAVLAENINFNNLASIKNADHNNELIMALFQLQYRKKMGLSLTLD